MSERRVSRGETARPQCPWTALHLSKTDREQTQTGVLPRPQICPLHPKTSNVEASIQVITTKNWCNN